MTELTEHAQATMRDLAELRSLGWGVATDIKKNDSRLIERGKTWPELPRVENNVYNSLVSRLMGIFLLSRSVDLYNWYNLEVLKLAIQTDKKLIDRIVGVSARIDKVINKAKKAGRDPVREFSDGFLNSKSAKDGLIRRVVHKQLGVFENPETELICACRNIIVHRRARDEHNDVAKLIANLGTNRAQIYPVDYPPGFMPIKVENGNLVIDAEVGLWARSMIENQVFLMDQNFAHVYKLPRKRWRPRPISRYS